VGEPTPKESEVGPITSERGEKGSRKTKREKTIDGEILKRGKLHTTKRENKKN